jgi:hypothetical protein
MVSSVRVHDETPVVWLEGTNPTREVLTCVA